MVKGEMDGLYLKYAYEFNSVFETDVFDVTEEKVFPSGGLIHPAGQSEIIHNVEEDLRLFSIVYVYEDHVLCDDPGIFWPVLYLFNPEKIIRCGITECHGAFLVFGRYISFEDVHYLFSTYSRFFFILYM